MSAASCPTHEELAGYVQGTLAEDVAETVAEHLDSCARCEMIVQQLERQTDSFVENLRRPVPEEGYLEDVECQRVLARVERIGGEAPVRTGRSFEQPEPIPPDLGSIHGCQLLEKLGEGGMGTVYRAWQPNLDRSVAVKLLPPERMKDQSAVARFRREMKAIGRLDHPNIVRALDAGEQGGKHFLVIEYVDGLDLSRLVRARGPLSIADACEVVRQAAVGLQYAHQHGLVHRDIKPSNLMLTSGGQVKILDLGLALLRREPGGEAGELTATDQVMGTYDYMAPEQWIHSHQVDIRADIYSLGCTLYKLLTGHAPFGGPKHKTALAKMLAHQQDPVPPIQQHIRDVPDPLVGVLERMMAKSPAERYATPAEVAEALAPFTTGCDLKQLVRSSDAEGMAERPSVARLPSTDEFVSSPINDTASHEKAAAKRAARRAGRRPFPLVVGIVGMLVLLGGGFYWSPTIIRFVTDKGTLVVQFEDPKVEAIFNQQGVTIHDIERDRKYTLRVRSKDLPSGRYRIIVGDEAGLSVDTDEFRLRRGGRTVLTVNLADRVFSCKRVEPAPIVIRGEPLGLAPGMPMSKLALVPEPASIKGVRCWTVETRGHRGEVPAVAFSPDGRVLATGCVDGVIRLWNPRDGKFLRALVGHDDCVRSITWSPDGKYLASGSYDTTIRFWDPQPGLLLRTVVGHDLGVTCVAWSPDGRLFASGSLDGSVRVWDASSGEIRHRLQHGCGINGVAWSADGSLLASASGDAVRIWHAESGQQQHVGRHTLGGAEALAWSPDGTMLASADWHPRIRKYAIRFWDGRTGERLEKPEISGEERGDFRLAWSPNGKTLVGAVYGVPFEVRFYDVVNGVCVHRRRQWSDPWWPSAVAVAYCPDGKTYVVSDQSGRVRVFDAGSHQLLRTLPGHASSVTSLSFSFDGKTLAAGYQTAKLRVWAVDSGESLDGWRSKPNVPIAATAWSPDGKTLTASLYEGVQSWDVQSRVPLRRLLDSGTGRVAWSPDGKTVALMTDGELRLIEPMAGEVLWRADRVGKVVWQADGRLSGAVAWSPDGNQVACGHAIYSAPSGQVLRTLSGATGAMSAFAFSPDGTALAGAGEDNNVRLWNVETGRLIQTFRQGHRTRIGSLCWLDGGRALASGSASEVCVWDTESGKLRQTLSGNCGALSPHNQLFATLGESAIGLRRLSDGKPLRTMVALRDLQYAVLSPQGHFRGSPGAEDELVYVVQTDQGQDTLTPEEFSKKYGWKNNPKQVDAK